MQSPSIVPTQTREKVEAAPLLSWMLIVGNGAAVVCPVPLDDALPSGILLVTGYSGFFASEGEAPVDDTAWAGGVLLVLVNSGFSVSNGEARADGTAWVVGGTRSDASPTLGAFDGGT